MLLVSLGNFGPNLRTNIDIGAQTSIIQNLSYFEHLAEPMAEFLQILAEQYDYPQLAEEILRLGSSSTSAGHGADRLAEI